MAKKIEKTQPSSVCRVNKNSNYTVMSNFHLRSKTLSLKAVGLLSKVLSLIDEWDYVEYGLKRTGCVGCPFNPRINEELEIIEKYEPKLYTAAVNIFGKSYEYTRKYREFVKMMNAKENEVKLCAKKNSESGLGRNTLEK